MTSYLPPDAALILRNISDGAEGATVAETAVNLTAAKHADFKAVFHVTAVDTADANETYKLSVEADADTAFGSPVEVGAITITAPGVYEIPLSGAYVEQKEAGTAKMRAKATLGGTTPSITYGAFIVPAV